MLSFIIPLFIAVITVLQDAHIIENITGCAKDNLLIAIFVFLGLCAFSRRMVLKWFWWILLALQLVFLIGETYFANFLPDDWQSTEDRLFGGYPVLQAGAAITAGMLGFIGLVRKQITPRETITCLISVLLIIISAQLWIIGNKNVENSPARAWSEHESVEQVAMTNDQGSLVGQEWIIHNTDYNKTVNEIDKFMRSSDQIHYYTAPRIGFDHPHIYRLFRLEGGQVIMETQQRDMDWGENMVWIWEYILSFVIVFIEAFMFTALLIAFKRGRREGKPAL